ncbi:MAG: BPL-N domain-containing protein [Candidatus Thorarchaeota archaeon]|jgi:glutamine amidotransferase-like uncharacterized protein
MSDNPTLVVAVMEIEDVLVERRITVLTVGIIALLLIGTIPGQQDVAAESVFADVRVDLTDVKVAVYEGTSLDSVIASTEALVAMYEWMNATVDIVNATQVQEGILDDGYEIFAVPGGNPITFTNRFKTAGRAAIRDWVSRGGSYFGICGGAMFAIRLTSFSGDTSYYQLNLVNGTCMGPIGGLSGMTTLHVNTSSDGPDLSGISTTLSSNYQGGGYYVADEGAEMYTLATYDENSQPALIASTLGTGTVCLSASHVEIEENSDRDGTGYYDDDLDDPDSEWDLMLQISIWQVESSTYVAPSTTTTTESTTEETTNTTESTTDNPLISLLPVVAVAGVVVVLVIAGIVLKRQ